MRRTSEVRRTFCLRLQHAADLLAKKTGTVAEICYAVVGFGGQANFTRAFKKQFGYSLRITKRPINAHRQILPLTCKSLKSTFQMNPNL